MDLAKLTNGLALIKQGLDDLDSQIRQELAACGATRKQAAAVRLETQQLQVEAEGARVHLHEQQDQHDDLSALLKCLKEQTDRAHGSKMQMQERITQLRGKAASLVETFEQQSDTFAAAYHKSKLEQQRAAIEQQERELERHIRGVLQQLQTKRQQLAQQTTAVKELRQKVADSRVNIKELKHQIASESSISNELMLELEQAQQEGPAAQQLAKLRHDIAEREEELLNQQCNIAAQEVELGRATSDIRQRQQEVGRKKDELADLNKTIRALGLTPVLQLQQPAAKAAVGTARAGTSAAAGVSIAREQYGLPPSGQQQRCWQGQHQADSERTQPNPHHHHAPHASKQQQQQQTLHNRRPDSSCPQQPPRHHPQTSSPKQQQQQQQYFVEEPEEAASDEQQAHQCGAPAPEHECQVQIEEVQQAEEGLRDGQHQQQLVLHAASNASRGDGRGSAAAAASSKKPRGRLVLSETVVTQTTLHGPGGAPGVLQRKVVVQELQEHVPSRSGGRLVPSKRTVIMEESQHSISTTAAAGSGPANQPDHHLPQRHHLPHVARDHMFPCSAASNSGQAAPSTTISRDNKIHASTSGTEPQAAGMQNWQCSSSYQQQQQQQFAGGWQQLGEQQGFHCQRSRPDRVDTSYHQAPHAPGPAAPAAVPPRAQIHSSMPRYTQLQQQLERQQQRQGDWQQQQREWGSAACVSDPSSYMAPSAGRPAFTAQQRQPADYSPGGLPPAHSADAADAVLGGVGAPGVCSTFGMVRPQRQQSRAAAAGVPAGQGSTGQGQQHVASRPVAKQLGGVAGGRVTKPGTGRAASKKGGTASRGGGTKGKAGGRARQGGLAVAADHDDDGFGNGNDW